MPFILFATFADLAIQIAAQDDISVNDVFKRDGGEKQESMCLQHIVDASIASFSSRKNVFNLKLLQIRLASQIMVVRNAKFAKVESTWQKIVYLNQNPVPGIFNSLSILPVLAILYHKHDTLLLLLYSVLNQLEIRS